MGQLCLEDDLKRFNIKGMQYKKLDANAVAEERAKDFLEFYDQARNLTDKPEGDVGACVYVDPKSGKFKIFKEAFLPWVKLETSRLAENLIQVILYNQRYQYQDIIDSVKSFNSTYLLPEIEVDMDSLMKNVISKLSLDKRLYPFEVVETLFQRDKVFQRLLCQSFDHFMLNFQKTINDEKALKKIWQWTRTIFYNQLAKIVIKFELDPVKRSIEDLIISDFKASQDRFNVFVSDVNYETHPNEDKESYKASKRKERRTSNQERFQFGNRLDEAQDKAYEKLEEQIVFPEDKDSLIGTITLLFTLRK